VATGGGKKEKFGYEGEETSEAVTKTLKREVAPGREKHYIGTERKTREKYGAYLSSISKERRNLVLHIGSC